MIDIKIYDCCQEYYTKWGPRHIWWKDIAKRSQAKLSFPRHVLWTNKIIQPFIFIEFGTGPGNMLKQYTKFFNHPNNIFYGIDWFCGLPYDYTESHIGTAPAGKFSTNGLTPHETGFLIDNRVSYIKTRFEDFAGDMITVNKDRQTVYFFDTDFKYTTDIILKEIKTKLKVNDILLFDQYINCEEEESFVNFVKNTNIKFEHFITNGNQVGFILKSLPSN